MRLLESEKERYDSFVRRRRGASGDAELLYAGDYQCPASSFGVIAVWDTEHSLLWFEVCESPPWDTLLDGIPEDTYSWCVSWYVSFCETASEANEVLYKAIGRDALIIGFDESYESV